MKAFISYSWDSDDHKAWVRRFVDDLLRNGVEVTLDQYDLRPGEDRFVFMESGVRDADVVLCVCTPAYVERANERERGVGVETSLITPQFFGRHAGKRFIPVIRSKANHDNPTPDYMAALVYVDFSNDGEYEARVDELLRHLHQKPAFAKPAVGPIPALPGVGPVVPTDTARLPSSGPSIGEIINIVLESGETDWEYFEDRNLYVLRAAPDITINRDEVDFEHGKFHEDWSSRFPDPVAYRIPHEIRWRDTPIRRIILVAVDGFRMELPLPKSALELVITDEQFRFARLINYFSPWGARYEEYLRRAGITVA